MDWAQLERGADSCEGGGALSSGAWLPFAVGSSTPGRGVGLRLSRAVGDALAS